MDERAESAQTAITLASTGPGATSLTAKRRFRRKSIIYWHGLVAWMRGPGWVRQGFLVFASFYLFAYPFWKFGSNYGIPGTVIWLVIAIIRARKHVDPSNMKLLQQNYAERKLGLSRLILDMQQGESMSAASIKRFQIETLELIANWVRTHRLDTSGTQIFVNLLVPDGDDVVVVARDRPHHRPTVARYRKDATLVGTALASGEAALTGDVFLDYPQTSQDKPYRSIFAMPVISAEDTVLGVVSVDSSRYYHFDLFKKDLTEGLMPYVALLVWTLQRRTPGTEP